MSEVSTKINGEIVSISKSDVRDAFERTGAEFSDFEYNVSPWHFIEVDGVRKPVKHVFYNIESVKEVADSRNDFGTLKVEEVFDQLGFESYNQKNHAAENLKESLEEILNLYPDRPSRLDGDTRLFKLLEKKVPILLNYLSDEKTDLDLNSGAFVGSAGQGNWANIPWVAVLHPDETDTTQKGVYIVYLFDPENQAVYATLNQGTTEVIESCNGRGEARETLEDRAEEIREKVDLEGFSTENPDLSDNDKLYEESTIYQKKYELGNLPESEQVEDDFVQLAEAYLDYLDTKEDLEYPDIEDDGGEKSIEDFETGEVDPESSKNYFWITADPSIWKVSELNEGDEKFYPAYLPSGNKARIFSNFEKASEGDRVVFYQSTPVKRVVAEGVVSDGLHKEEVEGYSEPVEGITLRYGRQISGEVSWSKLSQIPDLESSKPMINTAQGSIFQLDEKEFETILSLETPVNEKESDINPEEDISVDFQLEFDNLYFPEEEESLKNQIKASINSGKHVIFTGPPGTGKTELAEVVAEEMENDSNVSGHQLTTATSDWSTFDTVGGFMPEKNGGGDLEFSPGQVLKRFKDGERDQKNELLVIDEINRADIDKAFGQLFTVLSGQRVQLPFTAENDREIEVLPGSHERASNSPDKHHYVIPESWR
ncbi:MAG: MrcB family domain-containing protein [Candidatus Nanohalobium sp.]